MGVLDCCGYQIINCWSFSQTVMHLSQPGYQHQSLDVDHWSLAVDHLSLAVINPARDHTAPAILQLPKTICLSACCEIGSWFLKPIIKKHICSIHAHIVYLLAYYMY